MQAGASSRYCIQIPFRCLKRRKKSKDLFKVLYKLYMFVTYCYILLHCSAHNTTTLRVALVAGSAEVPHGPIFWHSDDSIVSSGWKLCPETPERPWGVGDQPSNRATLNVSKKSALNGCKHPFLLCYLCSSFCQFYHDLSISIMFHHGVIIPSMFHHWFIVMSSFLSRARHGRLATPPPRWCAARLCSWAKPLRRWMSCMGSGLVGTA